MFHYNVSVTGAHKSGEQVSSERRGEKLRIREFRKKAGLTQQELSDKAFISREQISRYETGKRMPDLASLIRLKFVFGCTLDELIEEEKKTTAS